MPRDKTNAERIHQEDLERIKRLRLMDDDFMKVSFKDNVAAVEYLLRIILGLALRIVSLRVEDVLPNLRGRGLRLDIHAKDAAGREYDIEIQRDDEGASAKRARYHVSIMDANALGKGEDYQQLPVVFLIFITENDIFKKGLPIYHIERQVQETGELFPDMVHIIYVNGAYRGDDLLGQLMRDLCESDPEKMSDSPLKETVKRMKNTEEGVSEVCKMLEEMRSEAEARGRAEGEARGEARGKAEGLAEGAKQATLRFVRNLLAMKRPYEEIAQSAETTVEEVQRIAEESGLAY